ncbi:formyl-CoA transferase [Bacillus sp. M6-12]|uniref:CaiB/BaiF CoA transferase family protein n=1 Tax=Bacillus sp. M6-12 TaxID=2054166 RepID=UPI000C757580|nr:CoA transferase [Bacillus sp. M6-12]PLS18570.1 formyl-CoA transferase [Bacillus sp. M6-12]
MDNTNEKLPLQGVRVIELGTLIAGPFTGKILADFGAEVIKVEPPDKADPMRNWGKEKDNIGLWWPVQSRNKKSITLNLREEKGQNILKEMIKESDVLIENFRPGTMEKWNLSYSELSKINEGLIMVRTSGYGQTGPYKSRAGFGSVGEAMGGLRYITGFPDRPPTRTGISIGDTLAGLFATIGCLIALHERTRSGKGQVVDTALYESVFAVMESIIPDYLIAGEIRERMGNTLPGVAPSNIYLTADEKYIVIGANADGVFKRLCEAMGEPLLNGDPKYSNHKARAKNMKELDWKIEGWTKTLHSEELLSILEKHGVPSGKIYSAKDIVEDRHYQEREMVISFEHPILGNFPMPGIIPKLSRTPGKVKHLGALSMGEHNQDVYKDIFKFSEEKIRELLEQKII